MRPAAEGWELAVIEPQTEASIVGESDKKRHKEVLALPKGLIDPGEKPAQTALREVREETGVEAEMVEKLGDVRYFYQRSGKRIFKRVTFYLFSYRAGSLEDHDDEVEEARWMPLAEAIEALSYDGEREMAERALSAIVPDR